MTKEIPTQDFIKTYMPKVYLVTYWKTGFPSTKITKELVGSNMENTLQLAKTLVGNSNTYSWWLADKNYGH